MVRDGRTYRSPETHALGVEPELSVLLDRLRGEPGHTVLALQKGDPVARVFYGNLSEDEKDAHDEAVRSAQLFLLKEMQELGGSSASRDYAEAYALISGLIEKPSNSVQN